MRTIVALLCVVWTVAAIWFYIYDDLALYLSSNLAEQVGHPEIGYADPLGNLVGRLAGGDGDDNPEKPIVSFPVVRYRYRVGAAEYEGRDLYIVAPPPHDLPDLPIRYDPARPHVSMVDGHFETWPYATTLLALVLMTLMMTRQRRAPVEMTRQPLKQLTAHLNQLRRDWQQATPAVVDGRYERKALVWSDDMLVLAHRQRSDDLVALARLFVIYTDRSETGESKATDATAVFRYTGAQWQATDQSIHDVPEEVKKSYPEYVTVHERIDENRNVIFAELLKRTRLTEPVKLSDNEIRNIVVKDDHDKGKNR